MRTVVAVRPAALAALTALALALAPAAAHAADAQRAASFYQHGEFKGRSILMVSYYTYGNYPFEHAPAILRDLGFTVDTLTGPAALPDLARYDQVWIVSGDHAGTLAPADLARLRAHVARGRGLYVLADNTPFTTEANTIGAAFHGIHVEGEYMGMKMVTVMSHSEVQKLIEEAMRKGDLGRLAAYRRAGMLDGKFYAEDHELLTGIDRIYEGGTICHMTQAVRDLDVILRASDNQSLVAVSKRQGERVVYDCGWTRLYYDWDKHAQTSTRWYQNVAAYLMGKRRADLP
jgi:hypothetical protein